MTSEELSLRIQRFDPSREKRPHFEGYSIPVKEGMTVLDALLHAKDRIDHSIALRFSCRMASCGSCGMKINGVPRLACETQVAHLRSSTITVQPMDNFRIERDLVVDMGSFFSKHASLSPHLVREGDPSEQESPTGEYLMTPEELDPIVQFTYCIKCGLCSSSCPTSSTDSLFPGPQALAQAYRFLQDVRDEAGKERIDSVDTEHGVWRCHFAGTCSAVCPKGVDPALGIQLLKRHVMKGKSPRRNGARVFPNPNKDLVKSP
jgi:succinate dehydrogenase / fumarate reductase, iron-sulfur subunit